MKNETNKQLETLSAIVIPIQKKYSSKTNALLEAINYIESHEPQYDNVVILDADNVVESNYLEQLNNLFILVVLLYKLIELPKTLRPILQYWML